MKVVKCGVPNCKNYVDSDEVTQIMYNMASKDMLPAMKPIWICEFCDDGSYEPVKTNVGGKHGNQSIEKVKRKRRFEDD